MQQTVRVDTNNAPHSTVRSYDFGPVGVVIDQRAGIRREVAGIPRSPGWRGTSDSLVSRVRVLDHRGMKRLIAGPLWFLAVWYGCELLSLLTGVPRVAGPVIALIVAATVVLDPMHLFWPVRSSRPTTSMASSALQASAK
jgi:hypothetical protein